MVFETSLHPKEIAPKIKIHYMSSQVEAFFLSFLCVYKEFLHKNKISPPYKMWCGENVGVFVHENGKMRRCSSGMSEKKGWKDHLENSWGKVSPPFSLSHPHFTAFFRILNILGVLGVLGVWGKGNFSEKYKTFILQGSVKGSFCIYVIIKYVFAIQFQVCGMKWVPFRQIASKWKETKKKN